MDTFKHSQQRESPSTNYDLTLYTTKIYLLNPHGFILSCILRSNIHNNQEYTKSKQDRIKVKTQLLKSSEAFVNRPYLSVLDWNQLATEANARSLNLLMELISNQFQSNTEDSNMVYRFTTSSISVPQQLFKHFSYM